MTMIKKFFKIETSYKFEIMDVFTALTILNVILVLAGFGFAPWVGIFNCVLNIVYTTIVFKGGHINYYTMQIALIVLNGYFLTL